MPACAITPPSATVCSPQTQQFCAPAGMSSYSWSGPGGFSAGTQCITVGVTGTYTVTIVAPNGCTNSCQATLTVNPLPTCVISPSSATICSNQTQQFCATSDMANYSWTGPGGFSAGTQCITVGVAGTYTVTIVNGNGCTNSCQATLTVNPLPTCSITPPSATICSTGSQQFCATAGMASYSWTGPSGFAASTDCITVSTGGIYEVTIVDGSGCTNSCQATLTVNPPPTITCPSDITTNTDAGVCSATLTFSPSATGSPTPTVTCTPSSGSAFPVGTNTVSCTASNECGTTNCTFTVIVNDTELPTITCPANVLTNTDVGLCVVSNVVIGVPLATNDNCGVSTVVNDAPLDLTFGTGTNLVIWTVTDIHNNQSTCTQEVVVVDNEPPTIDCPTNLTVSCASEVPASDTNAVSAADNCGPVTVSLDGDVISGQI